MEEYIVERLKKLISGHCYEPLREAVNKLFENLGTEKEADCTKTLINELKDSICTIEELNEFARSDSAKNIFGGEEGQKKFIKHVEEMNEKGEKYCDCPACKEALEIYNLLK